MKKIIALQAAEKRGKSTTISKLYDELLLENGYEIVRDKFEGYRRGQDLLAILEKHGKLIGISSKAEPYKLVKKRLTILIKAKCTIIVCACRLWGKGGKRAIQEFTEFQLEFMQKTIAKTKEKRKKANEKDAKHLFEIVEELVSLRK